MWQYMVLFFVVILIPIVLSKGKVNLDISNKSTDIERSRKFLVIVFGIIIVFSGIRSQMVGPDTPQYIAHFNRECQGVVYRLDGHFEWGYRIYVKVLALATHNPQVLLLVSAAIINFPIAHYIYKYSKWKFLSVILYLTVGTFTFQLTGIRQSIAMSICLIAIDFALERKILKYIVVICIASLFHKSALLFFPVYFFATPKINRKGVLIVIGGIVIGNYASSLFTFLGSAIGYEEYLGTEGVNAKNGWTYIAIMFITLGLYLICSQNDRNETKKDYLIDNVDRFMFVILVCALVLYMIRYQFRVAERVSLYYRQALIILLPNMVAKLRDEKFKMILGTLCIFLSIMLFFYWLDGSRYIYTSFWSIA